MGIQSSFQSILNVTDPLRSYWSIKLLSGKEVSERSVLLDLRAGGLRPIDWSLDIVSTGDIYKIKEVSLRCPDGQVARFDVDEPGTIFQLKIASQSVLAGGKIQECQMIGKVADKESGACMCKIWDRQQGLIHFTSSVYQFGTWRDGVLPLGRLSLDVLGLRL
jgi:hypothetical protein